MRYWPTSRPLHMAIQPCGQTLPRCLSLLFLVVVWQKTLDFCTVFGSSWWQKPMWVDHLWCSWNSVIVCQFFCPSDDLAPCGRIPQGVNFDLFQSCLSFWLSMAKLPVWYILLFALDVRGPCGLTVPRCPQSLSFGLPLNSCLCPSCESSLVFWHKDQKHDKET